MSSRRANNRIGRSSGRPHPLDLKGVRWSGDGIYRCLSYYFRVSWNRAGTGRRVAHLLRDFETEADPAFEPPTPGAAGPWYSIVDLGPRKRSRHRLYLGKEVLLRGESPSRLLSYMWWHVNLESVRNTGDLFLFHAGSVVAPGGGGVLLPGASGSGKSTLVGGLVYSGFGYLSDESGAMCPVTRLLHPYRRPLTLKSRALFEAYPDLRRERAVAIDGHWHMRADDIRLGARAQPSAVRYVVFPTFEPGAAPTLESLTPAETVIELARNAQNMSVYRRRALPLLADMASQAPAYRLRYERLGDAVKAITDLTQGDGTSASRVPAPDFLRRMTQVDGEQRS